METVTLAGIEASIQWENDTSIVVIAAASGATGATHLGSDTGTTATLDNTFTYIAAAEIGGDSDCSRIGRQSCCSLSELPLAKHGKPSVPLPWPALMPR